MIDRKLTIVLYLAGIAILVLGIANLVSVNELNNRVRRIELSQSKIQHKILNSNTPVNFDFNKGFPIGDSAAPVKIALFLDYECGYCKLFFQEVYPQLYDEYISPGLVQFVILDFPLDSHEYAFPIAQYSRCAQQNGTYASFINKVFENTDPMDNRTLDKIGNEIGLNLNVCMEDSSIYNGILKNINTGKSMGVNGTPTFIYNNQLIAGYKQYPEMVKMIESLLSVNDGTCN
jgi:protein-disulfide isomerase